MIASKLSIEAVNAELAIIAHDCLEQRVELENSDLIELMYWANDPRSHGPDYDYYPEY